MSKILVNEYYHCHSIIMARDVHGWYTVCHRVPRDTFICTDSSDCIKCPEFIDIIINFMIQYFDNEYYKLHIKFTSFLAGKILIQCYEFYINHNSKRLWVTFVEQGDDFHIYDGGGFNEYVNIMNIETIVDVVNQYMGIDAKSCEAANDVHAE